MVNDYNVVFKQGNGFYTWSSFKDEAEFKEKLSLLGDSTPIAEGKGVTQEKAIELCDKHNKPLFEKSARALEFLAEQLEGIAETLENQSLTGIL